MRWGRRRCGNHLFNPSSCVRVPCPCRAYRQFNSNNNNNNTDGTSMHAHWLNDLWLIVFFIIIVVVGLIEFIIRLETAIKVSFKNTQNTSGQVLKLNLEYKRWVTHRYNCISDLLTVTWVSWVRLKLNMEDLLCGLQRIQLHPCGKINEHRQPVSLPTSPSLSLSLSLCLPFTCVCVCGLSVPII